MKISKRSKMTSDQLKDYEDGLKWGPISPAYICPHCQTKGFLRTKPVKERKALVGQRQRGSSHSSVSMIANGLYRKDRFTHTHCGNCNSNWDF